MVMEQGMIFVILSSCFTLNNPLHSPYTCEVSTDATGANFAAMTVTTNVPGRNSRSNAKATDFALVARKHIYLIY